MRTNDIEAGIAEVMDDCVTDDNRLLAQLYTDDLGVDALTVGEIGAVATDTVFDVMRRALRHEIERSLRREVAALVAERRGWELASEAQPRADAGE